MKSVDQKLIENKYKYIRKEYLQTELAKIEERLEREMQTLQRLKKQLDKESEDVERLEHASVNRLLGMLNGRNELRLEKEKAEAFRAALDYKLKQQDVEILQYQKNLLEQELKPYETLAQEYQGLLEIKRKSLADKELNNVRTMEKRLSELVHQQKEIKEAMDNGKKLCTSFTYILDNLSDLVEESTDTKYLWYPVLSQEQIDDEMKEIGKLNDLWKVFEKELQDTDISLPKGFDQDFLLKVSDYCLEQDKVTKRINTSFEHLNATYSSVREILNLLETRSQENEHSIYDLELKIKESIESN